MHDFPRGWYPIGVSSDFAQKPVEIKALNRSLVAYRGQDQGVIVLDAVCPHLGANLAQGTVEGDSLRCPFHGWRWGAQGQCEEIPYAEQQKSRANLKRWLTHEVNQMVFLWYCAEGSAPDYSIPPLDCEKEAGWSNWHVKKMKMPGKPFKLVQNCVDRGHFPSVHGAEIPSAEFQYSFTEHVASQRYPVYVYPFYKLANHSISWLKKLSQWQVVSHVKVAYHGPACQLSELDGSVATRNINTHCPIDDDHFHLWYAVKVRSAQLPFGLRTLLGKIMQRSAHNNFAQDFPILAQKTDLECPVFCDGDGPFNKLAQWYDAFRQPRQPTAD